jgi:hypothetical protein
MSDDILSQASQVAQSAEELARDKEVYLYVTAMDRGDFDMMVEILARAEGDPMLADLLWRADLAMVEDIVIPPEVLERAHKMVKRIFKQYYEEW